MRVCIDTNVLVRLFGTRSPFAEIKGALVAGMLELAVSNEILFEYEEVVTRLTDGSRWRQIEGWFETLSALHGNVVRIDPQYQFHVIATDPDDNKFIDCAIAAEADFVITDDTHFAALRKAGYKPQPITPEEFITQILAANVPPLAQGPTARRRPPS